MFIQHLLCKILFQFCHGIIIVIIQNVALYLIFKCRFSAFKTKKGLFSFAEREFGGKRNKFLHICKHINSLKLAKPRTVRKILHQKKRGYEKPLNINGGDYRCRKNVQDFSIMYFILFIVLLLYSLISSIFRTFVSFAHKFLKENSFYF